MSFIQGPLGLLYVSIPFGGLNVEFNRSLFYVQLFLAGHSVRMLST